QHQEWTGRAGDDLHGARHRTTDEIVDFIRRTGQRRKRWRQGGGAHGSNRIVTSGLSGTQANFCSDHAVRSLADRSSAGLYAGAASSSWRGQVFFWSGTVVIVYIFAKIAPYAIGADYDASTSANVCTIGSL